ncbi:hypothetical protein BH23PLA1_BH23PLA1_28640 [soil metagenome]
MRITLRSAREQRTRRRGAAAVEMALLLPILTTLLLIAVDFCRLFYHYTIVANCARNGAMYASDPAVGGDSPHSYNDQGQPVSRAVAIQNAALHDARNESGQISLTPTPTVNVEENASFVAVTVRHDFQMLTSYLNSFPFINSRTVQLGRTVRMDVMPAVPSN